MKLIKGSDVNEIKHNTELLENNNKKIIYKLENWYKAFYINFNKVVYQIDEIIFYDKNGRVFNFDRNYLVDNNFLALILDSEVKRVKLDKLDFTTNNNYIVINDKQYLSMNDYKIVDLYINIDTLENITNQDNKEDTKDYIYINKIYNFTLDNQEFKVKHFIKGIRKYNEIKDRKIKYLKSLIDKYENMDIKEFSEQNLYDDLELTRFE